MADVFIALGSNLGDRAGNLSAARDALRRGVLEISATSSVYETEPWGPVPQGRYLNQVVRGDTALTAHALLEELFRIERAVGRDREGEQRFGPRTLDLDILLYDGQNVREPDLEIPHPRMMQRPFVLVPLAEIAPDLVVGGVAVRDALARLDCAGVVPYRAS